MSGNGIAGLPSAQELRLLIREVLRDALAAGYLQSPAVRHPAEAITAAGSTSAPELRALPVAPPTEIPAGTVSQVGPPASGPGAPDLAASGAARHVRLVTDEDLREFVLTVLRLADNPARRRDLLTGRLRFTLNGWPGGQPNPADSQARPETFRIEAGAVTERAVQAAAKAGNRLVLGRRAVLTPLARDRALTLGVPIERER